MDHLISGSRPLIVLTGHYTATGSSPATFLECSAFPPGFGRPHARLIPISSVVSGAFRQKTGQSLIPKTGGLLNQMVEVLREQPRIDVFLADQDAGQRAGFFSSTFSNSASPRPTRRSAAPGHRAPEHPSPVGVARRIGPGFRYELRLRRRHRPRRALQERPTTSAILTQQLTSAFERLIRQDPTQYLWAPSAARKHRPKRFVGCPFGQWSIVRCGLSMRAGLRDTTRARPKVNARRGHGPRTIDTISQTFARPERFAPSRSLSGKTAICLSLFEDVLGRPLCVVGPVGSVCPRVRGPSSRRPAASQSDDGDLQSRWSSSACGRPR